jgi:hypothetical protein
MKMPCATGQEGRNYELTRQVLEPPVWLRPEMLASLAELNEQYVDSMAMQVMSGAAPHGHPLVQSLRPLLLALDPAGRRRAAACPYLLVDAGFADPQRWLWAQGYRVRDGERTLPEQPLIEPQAIALARLVFTYAWHLARAHRSAARVLLGMSSHSAAAIATCTLRQITDLAEVHPHWLQPRWPGHSRMWRELLSGAIEGEGPRLEQARMRGVQLLAADVRSSVLL